MNKYARLLTTIAEEFRIRQGKNESETDFKVRIIYSALSRLAYARLWDKLEQNKSVISIDRFKNKISDLLEIYLELYPEIKISENLPAEIYDLYLKTGGFYHRVRNISAAMFNIAERDGILFLRGITPSHKVYLSGAGFYLVKDGTNLFETVNFKSVIEMFALPNKTLQAMWTEIISGTNWQVSEPSNDMEFLRMSPPFNKEYWQGKPERDGRISLARVGKFEPRIYYLYKFDGTKFLCCQIPNYLIYDEFFANVPNSKSCSNDTSDYKSYRGGIYRKISCACLATYSTLPPIKFKVDGAIVRLKFEYLPPPPELYLLCLYSWAQQYANLPSNFARVFDAEVFFALKKCFEEIGYTFIEE